MSKRDHLPKVRVKPGKNVLEKRKQEEEANKRLRQQKFIRLSQDKERVYRSLHKRTPAARSGWRWWIYNKYEADIRAALDAKVTEDNVPSEKEGKWIGYKILIANLSEINAELNKREIPYNQRRTQVKEIPVEIYHKWRKDNFLFAKVPA